MSDSPSDAQAPAWERQLVAAAVDHRFAAVARPAVLAELARWRAELLASMKSASIDRDRLVRVLVQTQLMAIERSGGDPAFFSEQRHLQEDDGLGVDREALYCLQPLIRQRQLMAKDLTALIEMLKASNTLLDALSVLASKGEEARPAVPYLVDLLGRSDQLECCQILKTLQALGPAAQAALPAISDLARDPDYLLGRAARAALKAIAPERAAAEELAPAAGTSGLVRAEVQPAASADELCHSAHERRPSMSAWQDYRARRRLFWFAWLGFIPGVLGLSCLCGVASGGAVRPVGVAMVWLLFFAVAGIRLSGFPCPRCHQPFFSTWWYSNPLAGCCVHCGLKKWSEPALQAKGSTEREP